VRPGRRRTVLLDARRYVRLRSPGDQGHFQGGAFALAFPPGYRAGGPVYLLYTRRDGRVHLDRFHHGRPRTIVSVPQTAPIDVAGDIAFGPGGLLYASFGFGADPESSQDPATLAGKVVRLDPPEPPNFGWPFFEGRERRLAGGPATATRPALAIRHSRRMCAIVGGGFRRGRYLYGDVCSGRIRSVRLGASRARDDRSEHTTVPYLVSFGRDGRGRLYVASLYGRVYRLG